MGIFIEKYFKLKKDNVTKFIVCYNIITFLDVLSLKLDK